MWLAVRLFEGVNRARNPVKLSAVISPQATSSARASSTSVRTNPVCSTKSLKNDAPYDSRWSYTCSPCDESFSSFSPLTFSLGNALSHAARFFRLIRAIGVERIGPDPTPFGGLNLAQTTRPERQSESSHSGS